MFNLFLPQKPLRALRLCEIILVFISRKGARVAEKYKFILFLHKTPLRTLRLGERKLYSYLKRESAIFFCNTSIQAVR